MTRREAIVLGLLIVAIAVTITSISLTAMITSRQYPDCFEDEVIVVIKTEAGDKHTCVPYDNIKLRDK